MYAVTSPAFRPPIPQRPRPRRQRTRPGLPGLLDNAPAFRTLDEVDAWIQACKRPTHRQPGVLTDEQWEARRPPPTTGSPDEHPGTWTKGKGGIRKARSLEA